jgi:competence protein ComEA
MDKIRIVLFSLLLCLSLSLYAAEAININTADQETLMTIKGVGEKRAEAIVAFRKEHGPFSSVDDLTRVEGIGQSTVDSNRDSLTVGK